MVDFRKALLNDMRRPRKIHRDGVTIIKQTFGDCPNEDYCLNEEIQRRQTFREMAEKKNHGR